MGNYKVGDHAQGGIIFYVDPSGEHGLVAAISDQGNDIPWQSTSKGEGYLSTGLHDEGIGKGAANTKSIIQITEQHFPDASSYYAAKICDELDSGGFQDWYLPSLDELKLMYNSLHLTGLSQFYTGFGGGFGACKDAYWSSNEMAPLANIGPQYHVALLFRFSSGHVMAQGQYPKNTQASVRAVRSF